jgi:ParB-like chromosome segregation protein Spo0J
LVDRNDVIHAGVARHLAAQLLGMTDLPTICLEDLTPAQACAFMIADNRLSENSAWDNRILGQTFLELSDQSLHFCLEDTGLEVAEIDLLIEGLDGERPNEADPADAIIARKTEIAITQRGDAWDLAVHKSICNGPQGSRTYQALFGARKQALSSSAFPSPSFADDALTPVFGGGGKKPPQTLSCH